MALDASSTLWIWITLFAVLGIMSVFVAIAGNRKWKGFKLVVLRDMRNQASGPVKYWAMYDSKKDEYIKLYSNIFRPIKSGLNPPFDLSGFSYQRTVYAIRSPTGHPEDDSIVPIHLPMVGQASAIQYSQEVSAAIIHTLDLKNIIDKKHLKFGDIVTYDDKTYSVDGIYFWGVKLGYDITENMKGYDGKPTTKTVRKTISINDSKKIDKIAITSTGPDNRVPGMTDFLGSDWVLEKLGVVPVEDANVLLRSAKDAIASFNSKVTERQQSVMSLFGKYPWLIPMAIMIFVVAIASTIFFYGVGQTVSSSTSAIQNVATNAIQKILGTGISPKLGG